MKLLALAASLGFACLASAQIEVGPVVRQIDGPRYYRIAAGTWSQVQAAAAAMGGQLVSIHDASFNNWIATNVVAAGGNNEPCYIGLTDEESEGVYRWVNGDRVLFTSWRAGEPNNQGNEDATMITTTGLWNDVPVAASIRAVVQCDGPLRVPGEFATIQAAIDAAFEGQTVEVAPGEYTGPVDFRSKSLVVRSTHGPRATTIRVSSPGVQMNGGSQRRMTFEGFTVLPGSQQVPNLISLTDGPTVRNCIVHGAQNGITIVNRGVVSDTIVTGCFFGIVARGLSPTVEIAVQNCTIAGNRNGLRPESGSTSPRFLVDIANTIFVDNLDSTIFPHTFATVRLTHSNTPGLSPGAGNISANPLFIGAPGPDGLYGPDDDYTPAPGSPCIDAGSNAARKIFAAYGTPLDAAGGTRFTDDPAIDTGVGPGAVIDMGAVESNQPRPSCPADFNADQFLDFFDYDAFVQAYETGCPS